MAEFRRLWNNRWFSTSDYVHYPSEGSLYVSVQRGGQLTYGSHTFWETGAGIQCFRLKGGSLTTTLEKAMGSRHYTLNI